MHICMVVFTDLRFDYRVYREATALQAAGNRITIVSTDFAGQRMEGWDDIELRLLPTDRTRSLRRTYPSFWRWAYPLLVDLRADAYHAHDLDALLPAARAARKLKAALVYDSHEFFTEQSSLIARPWIRGFWRLLEGRLIGQADQVLTVSRSIAAALRQRYGLESVHVVRNLPPYRAPVASDRIRRRLGLSPERQVVLYQGGFLTDNGLAEQIDAAADFGNAALVLLGDGPCEPALRRQVAERNLAERVYFIPRVPFQELHEYTCSADLGLCLIKGTGDSFYYSMPNKLFEYLMAGLPVLASDFPEMRRVVTETACGAVAKPTDTQAVAAAVRELLEDSSLRMSCRQAALAAARRYNWEAEAPGLLRVYQDL